MKSKNNPADIIRGALPLAFITLNLAFWIVPLVLLALTKAVIPVPGVRRGLYRIMIGMYALACWIDSFFFKAFLGIHFETDSLEGLNRDQTYLILSNHKSWADILVYQTILINRVPIIKFIVKKELLYLPLVGLICWAYEYPMVQRRSFKNRTGDTSERQHDLNILQDKLGDISRHPAAIINFGEGTRFNREKQSKYGSPYRNLLKPRAGGLFFILSTFGSKIDYLLDFTISYDCSEPIFFKFLGRNCKRVRVRMNRIPMPELLHNLSDETGKLEFGKVETWLKERWQEKDTQLDRLLPN